MSVNFCGFEDNEDGENTATLKLIRPIGFNARTSRWRCQLVIDPPEDAVYLMAVRINGTTL
jgi:hypothetical protein